MRNFSFSVGAAALALTCALVTGCNLLPGGKDKKSSDSPSPTSPTPTTPTVSMDVFAGTWASATSSTPATGCGDVKYAVTPVSATTANVAFAATCAINIAVNGGGTGTLEGSTLNWSANGLVSQGGVNCPFSLTNGKAVQDAASTNIVVTYSGTVCGIPVSGTETVKK
jgi:predicted small secreted protein